MRACGSLPLARWGMGGNEVTGLGHHGGNGPGYCLFFHHYVPEGPGRSQERENGAQKLKESPKRRVGKSASPAHQGLRLKRIRAKVALIGVVAGLLSGYVGVGGGFIMVPLFMALLSIPMRLASGTSLIAVCILSIPGTIEQGFLGNIRFSARYRDGGR